MGKTTKSYSLVLDVGTTGIKGVVFDSKQQAITTAYTTLNKRVSNSRVEQNPEEIFKKSCQVLKQAVKQSKLKPTQFKNFGITNQRETVVAWNATTSKPAGPAIVWEDSRTKQWCRTHYNKYNKTIQAKTGLKLEPYFSGSKLWWMLQNIPAVAKLATTGDLKLGTLDSWLIWNFDSSHPHLTDITNASRTLLYNIKTGKWDAALLKIFGIKTSFLPTVLQSKANYGQLHKSVLGFTIPIEAVCGDQQSSTYAVGTTVGNTKVTFGTGTFVAQVLPKFNLNKNFYTTVVPSGNRHKYILEAKIDKSAEQVSPNLKYPKKLKPILARLAKATAQLVQKLPHKPKTIVIDGGISQSDVLLAELQTRLPQKIQRQTTHNGTALGIAKLLN